jgi:hypothetical protein
MSARQLLPKDRIASAPRMSSEPPAPATGSGGSAEHRPVPASSFERERPNHWGMLPGTPEVTIGGGMITSLLSPGRPNGTFNLDGALGVNRYLAVVGSMNTVGEGASILDTDVGVRFTEVLFGLRVSASNRSRVTPFATGLFGFGRHSRTALSFSHSHTNVGAGAGGGVEVNFTRTAGFRFEARATRGVDYPWLLHANFGAFYRFGR